MTIPVRRSLLFSIIDKYLTQVITIGLTSVMARLLTPAETGIFMTGYALVLMIESFRDFGISTYIVQRKNIDLERLRTAFSVTMLLSLTLGILLYLTAGLIGRLYNQPELTTILKIGTIGFLLVPFGTPTFGMLRRNMAFSTLAWISVAGTLSNASITITLAWLGFGAQSFMWGFVAASSTATLLALLSRCDIAVFRPSLRHWREIGSFGGVVSLVNLLNIAFDLIPRLLLGHWWGFAVVGMATRAVTLCQLPDRALVGALQPVLLPAMAARVRIGGDLKEIYLRGHQMMSAVQWPILAVLALLAVPAVRIVLGPQWLEAAPLVRMIALATMMLAPSFMTYPLLVSVGRINDSLTASLISLIPSALIVGVAAFFGAAALAASMFVTAPLQMGVAFWFIARVTGARWQDMVTASQQSALITIAAASMPGLIVATSPTGFDLDITRTVLAAGGAAVGWLAAVCATGHPLSSELLRLWRSVTQSLSRSAA